MEMIRGRDWRRCQKVRGEIERGGARTSGGDDWRGQTVGAALDAGDGWTDSQIAEALDTSFDTVASLRQQLVEEGFEATLARKYNPNSVRPGIFDGAAEAKLIASAGWPAPARGTTRRALSRRQTDRAGSGQPEHAHDGLALRRLPASGSSPARRFEWHCTPKHGGWLDLAESELAVRTSQCLDRRIPVKPALERQVAAWEAHRNKHHAKADWQFSTNDARVKLERLYPQF
jgi:hypothetical protein